jgi:hypothetical protein
MHPRSLICTEDKDYFKHMVSELCSKHGLGVTYDELFVNRWVIFWPGRDSWTHVQGASCRELAFAWPASSMLAHARRIANYCLVGHDDASCTRLMLHRLQHAHSSPLQPAAPSFGATS